MKSNSDTRLRAEIDRAETAKNEYLFRQSKREETYAEQAERVIPLLRIEAIGGTLSPEVLRAALNQRFVTEMVGLCEEGDCVVLSAPFSPGETTLLFAGRGAQSALEFLQVFWARSRDGDKNWSFQRERIKSTTLDALIAGGFRFGRSQRNVLHLGEQELSPDN
mgnify:CR=1 FL=1